ncbi:MAG: hypothetical protein Q3M30_15045 [Candidatus Electrothrix sp. Rat3]|nr:hypothetical protein [Candidatus Electrothrix rattekaaiensis]
MIVELVKLGFLGFATAILVLSYLLLQKIMTSKDFEGDNLLIRCREIRLFMLMSFGVILVGMTWDLLDPKVNVKFDVSPKGITKEMEIRVSATPVNINGEDVQMQNRNEVSIDLTELDRKIFRLETDAAGTQNYLKAMKIQQAQTLLHDAPQSEEAGI